MKSIMSIAAGLAIGYFVYQYIVSNNKGTTNGRIHKSARDKKIAGVCGGIAEYLNADPAMIRLAFLLVCALGGSGIMAYIIAALVMPESREAAE